MLNGKDPQQLTELLYDYELDILTSPLQGNHSLLQKYAWTLLIAGNYLDLGFFLSRNKEVNLSECRYFRLIKLRSLLTLAANKT